MPPSRVDQELTEGDVLDFGGGAEVISIPGHTDGSIAIHVPAHRLLFAGDTIAHVDGRIMLGVFNADRPKAIASFRRLAELDLALVCVGHGDPITGKWPPHSDPAARTLLSGPESRTPLTAPPAAEGGPCSGHRTCQARPDGLVSSGIA
ncbi:MBL fold metallo-hydrolase [Nonomuraea glycinis]|uniref:MBL fold metallo-hydrolase n=1 Tax=Nonomuraea glycinis TaxID=2047744 RepID=UPI0033A30403